MRFFVIILFAIYIAGIVLLYLRQNAFIYYPLKEIDVDPVNIGFVYEDLIITTYDGIKLNAWYFKNNDDSPILLFCHGNAGNIGHRLFTISLFLKMGFSVLIFDYRGYGKSDGVPTEEGTYIDAITCYDFLVKDKGCTNIVVYGESLGGAVAAFVASKRKCTTLILESTFTSIPELGQRLYPLFPVRILCRFKYNTLDYLKQVKIPVIVAHSREDEMVPYDMGRRLYEVALPPKLFGELHGKHNDGGILISGGYRKQMVDFLNRYCGFKLKYI